MPSLEDINKLKKKVKEKSEFTKKLIEELENWQKKINLKIEELKQNLKDEISLLEKIVMNFNNTFINYNYFNVFKYINKNVCNQNNNNKLIEFYNTYNFEEKTKILFEVFKYLGKKKEEIVKSQVNKVLINLSFDFIKKISNDIFFGYSNEYIYLLNYDEIQKRIFYNSKIPFKEKIYSVSSYDKKNRIFICLLNSRKILILDYNNFNINNNIKEINDDLMFNNSNHFNKCIKLNDKVIAASDKFNIILWIENENDFILLKKIEILSNTEN